MGVFSGGEWWTEGHGDYQQATRALHSLQLQQLCAELRKSKAVFTPHLPGRFLEERDGWEEKKWSARKGLAL